MLTKSNAIEHDSTKTISIKNMAKEVGQNTKKIFMPPILKYTWISIVINLSFHIGYAYVRFYWVINKYRLYYILGEILKNNLLFFYITVITDL